MSKSDFFTFFTFFFFFSHSLYLLSFLSILSLSTRIVTTPFPDRRSSEATESGFSWLHSFVLSVLVS